METDASDFVLVRSIVELGRNLGLHVTAEGVETESVWRRLRELGCDYAQGFYSGAREPAEECRRLILAAGGRHRAATAARRGISGTAHDGGRARTAPCSRCRCAPAAASPPPATPSPYVVVLRRRASTRRRIAQIDALQRVVGFAPSSATPARSRASPPSLTDAAGRAARRRRPAVAYVTPTSRSPPRASRRSPRGETVPAGIRRVGGGSGDAGAQRQRRRRRGARHGHRPRQRATSTP